MIKSVLCVRLRNWPIDRLRRERGHLLSDEPFVLTRAAGGRELVVALSDEARALSIRRGMTLAEARALYAGLRHAPHDPSRDARGLNALARWMSRFTPAVEVQPPALLLDLTGCDRVFGGFGPLVSLVLAALDRFGLNVRAAMAPSVGAAWALTFGRDTHGQSVGSRDLAAALAPLPVGGLRVGDDVTAALTRLGVETIGRLATLPREALPARFGDLLTRRLDQAYGRLPEPLTPLTFHKPIGAAVDFDGVVTALETLWDAMRRLLGQVVGELAKRGRGAKQVDVTFVRPEASPLKRSIHLSAACRDTATLFNLLRCAMEMAVAAQGKNERANRATGPAARKLVRFAAEGFVAISLDVPASERLTEEQISLLGQDATDAGRELARLVERLSVKLGPEAVVQASAVESHLPENAYRLDPPRPAALQSVGPTPPYRPLHLLGVPTEIRVMVSPSHDRDGRPVAFVHEGRVRKVPHAVGPERIAGPWWLGRGKTRDYFDAADEAGERYWLFRVTGTGKWYLHGRFE